MCQDTLLSDYHSRSPASGHDASRPREDYPSQGDALDGTTDQVPLESIFSDSDFQAPPPVDMDLGLFFDTNPITFQDIGVEESNHSSICFSFSP